MNDKPMSDQIREMHEKYIKEPRFTAEDFSDYYRPKAYPITGASQTHEQWCAEIANKKLQSWLGDVVYCIEDDKGCHVWGKSYEIQTYEKDGHKTHQARLFGVTEIKKKPCEHTAWGSIGGDGFTCSRCGVRLKAKWEVCE